LSNNAYQAGQAIEDFAVGFSLNGFAGGIRGAANNVAFLLNDMSRLDSVQKKIGAGWAKQLPLIAGIGSALAITVLPAMIEWLGTLDDVELKLKSIQERIKQTAKDSDFSSGLRAGNDALLDTLRDAGSVKDVLEEIKRINSDADQNQKKISESVGALNKSGDTAAAIADLTKLSQATEDYIEKQRNLSTGFGGPGGVSNEVVIAAQKAKQKSIAEAESLRDSIRKIREDVRAAEIEVLFNGDEQAEKIQKANESFKGLSKTIEDLQKKGGFSTATNIDEAKAGLEAYRIELEKIAELSAQTQNLKTTQLTGALQAVVDKSDELAFGIDVARANAKGLVDEEALLLLQLQEGNAEFRKRLNLQLELARRSNVSPELVNEANKKATETQFRLNEIEVLKEIKKREEEIDKIQEKKQGRAKFTEFEQFAKDLQVNVLGPKDENTDAIEENTKEIKELYKVLDILREERDRNLEDLDRDPNKIKSDLEAIQKDTDEKLKRLILPLRERFILFADDVAEGIGINGPDAPSQQINDFDMKQVLRSIGGPGGIPTSSGEIMAKVAEVAVIAIRDAVGGSIEEAISRAAELIVNSQNGTKEEVKKLDTQARAK
jgi:hypothetical protein